MPSVFLLPPGQGNRVARGSISRTMARIILALSLLALAACSGQGSDPTQSQQPTRGLYGSFNGGGNAM